MKRIFRWFLFSMLLVSCVPAFAGNSAMSTGKGAPVNAPYVTQASDGGLTGEYVLTAGPNISLTPVAGNPGSLTVSSTSGGGGEWQRVLTVLSPTVSGDSVVADGGLTVGKPGTTGVVTWYSEQGATDYSVTLRPNAAMTSDANFYLPADEPVGTYFLKVAPTGIMSYDSSAYLISEADTLLTVTGRGATTPTLCSFQNASGITLGKVDTANIPGYMRFVSAGSSNSFSTYIQSGTMLSSATYTLPTALPGADGVLKSTNAGVLSWDTSVPITTETDPVVKALTGIIVSNGSTISSITNNSASWDSAYSWGNHALAGYLTAEVDTLATVTARGATTAVNIGVGNLTSGANGVNGRIIIYSEQGATDYVVELRPNAAMTSDAIFYLPADEPVGTYFLKVASTGVMSYDSNTYLTSASITPSIFSTFGGSGAQGAVIITANTNFSAIDSATAGVAEYTNLTIGVAGGLNSVADNGSGKARFETDAAHNLTSTNSVTIANTTNYNGVKTVTVIDPTHFDTNDSYVLEDVSAGTFLNTPTLTIDTGFAYIGVSGTLSIVGTITADGQGGEGGTFAGGGIAAGGTQSDPGYCGIGAQGAGLIDTDYGTYAKTVIDTNSATRIFTCGIAGAGGGGGSGGGYTGADGGNGAGAGDLGGKGGLGSSSTGGAVGDPALVTPVRKTDLSGLSANLATLASSLGGGGGGGANSGAGGNYYSGRGGGGGGLVYAECYTLNFAASGVVTADGENGVAGDTNGGGGGGGGGGVAIMRAITIAANSGSVTITGGTGGGGGKAGGNGAAGYSVIVDEP